jgi:hypothetical protein
MQKVYFIPNIADAKTIFQEKRGKDSLIEIEKLTFLMARGHQGKLLNRSYKFSLFSPIQ